jgi:hypothetical protein
LNQLTWIYQTQVTHFQSGIQNLEKEKEKKNHMNPNWAGPVKPLGPWPSPACPC